MKNNAFAFSIACKHWYWIWNPILLKWNFKFCPWNKHDRAWHLKLPFSFSLVVLSKADIYCIWCKATQQSLQYRLICPKIRNSFNGKSEACRIKCVCVVETSRWQQHHQHKKGQHENQNTKTFNFWLRMF